MPDHSTPKSEEQIVQLLHLVEATHNKVDALMDCVGGISLRLDGLSRQLTTLEQQFFVQTLAEADVVEKIEELVKVQRITEELQTGEEEHAMQRLSTNMVSASEFANLMKGVGR